ncbi:hypothetical protein QMG83_04095 [Salinibacterium sp. G-O1]|uniref:hypothetical protein n=1 Tax=Salinibacterium sp. G-O1 TaxID=3046208 RepID=UPI0024BA0973|nr:hypothetical protein [Salinibacterium sp. G-O1]MDJ0334397.1 hypothetical protein [Salinibacterium sp. G-O1]
MPPALTITLIAIPVLLFGARVALPGIPLKRYARTSPWVDIALIIIGAVGLVLHCVAMFYRGLIEGVAGSDGYLQAVNGMGGPSIALYVVPALLALAGLRRQQPLALVIVAITLVAVGVTMYNGGPLAVHLAAITAAAIALALTTALLVLRPRRSKRVRTPR